MTVTRRRASKPGRFGGGVRWLVIRVVLVAQGGERLGEPPGRDLLASGSHTFAELAAGIDRAFARWDLSHLHEFRLADGRRVIMPDPDGFEEPDDGLDERDLLAAEGYMAGWRSHPDMTLIS